MKYYYLVDDQKDVHFMSTSLEVIPEEATELTYEQYRATLNSDRIKQVWKLVGDQPKLVERKQVAVNG